MPSAWDTSTATRHAAARAKSHCAVTILLLGKPPDPVGLTHLALISKAYRPFTRRFLRWHARYHPGKTRAYGKIARYNKVTSASRVP